MPREPEEIEKFGKEPLRLLSEAKEIPYKSEI